MKMYMKQLLILLVVSGIFVACGTKNAEPQDKTEETTPEVQTVKATTIKISKADFLTKVANYETSAAEWKYLGDKPAIVDFYADWCGPCRAIAPFLEELAAEYGDRIYIYKVDVDNEQELASAFGIRSIPSLLFIPMEGKPQMLGGGSKEDLKKQIDEILLKK